MTAVRTSRIWGTILLTITIFSLSCPAYAEYSGGTGVPDDPYQIATAEDLMLLGDSPEDYDKHFILTADIDLDPNLPGGKVFDKAVIAPDVDSTRDSWWNFDGSAFTGTLNGNGHVISHLVIRGEGYLGLFGCLRYGGRVRDLGMVDVNVSGSGHRIGALVGSNETWLRGGIVANCHSTGVVSGGGSVGGLIGYNGGHSAIVVGCYSDCAVTGAWYDVGGLVGRNYGYGSVIQCYSSGSASSRWEVGGLVGSCAYASITDCYSMADASGEEDVGGLVGLIEYEFDRDEDEPDMYTEVVRCYSVGRVSGTGDYIAIGGLIGYDDNGAVVDCFWDTEASGQMVSDGGTGITTAEMHDPGTFTGAGWDFVGQPDPPHDVWAELAGGGYPILSWQLPREVGLPVFSGGTGEPNSPYLISTAEELNRIGHNQRLMNCHFKLLEHVDLSGTGFYVIGDANHPFEGTFDGSGCTVSHVTIKGIDHLGLFGLLAVGSEVRNLGVVDINVVGLEDYVGGLAGVNEGIISNCSCTGIVSGRQYVSGLTGVNERAISNCSYTGVVNGDWPVGGLVGQNDGTVTESCADGTVAGKSRVGGLVGYHLHGVINFCYSTGAVSGSDSVGGLVGHNGGSVASSYSTGTVSGHARVGGLVGYNYRGYVSTSYSTGTVSGNYGFGGLVGMNNDTGSITNSYSAGTVSGFIYVGGLVGANQLYNRLAVIASFWDAQTSSQAESAGGIGLTTAQMQDINSYLDAGWDFVDETANGNDDIWWIDEGKDYPRLWWELIPEN